MPAPAESQKWSKESEKKVLVCDTAKVDASLTEVSAPGTTANVFQNRPHDRFNNNDW